MKHDEQNEKISGSIQTEIFTARDNGYQSNKFFVTYHINEQTYDEAFLQLEGLYELCDKYIFSEEYGKTGNTPHIQGGFILKSKMRASTIAKQFFKNGVTLRKLKNWGACFNYCLKEGNRIETNCNVPEPTKTINTSDLFNWQIKMLDIIKSEPDDRVIYWITGRQGSGKTQFIKYLVVNYNAIILNGRPSDMKNGIVEYIKKNNNCPKLILSNIGFDKNLNNIHYSGYEDIKDMCFYSGKYEGGMVCGNNPHLIIFANGNPETDNKKFKKIEI